MRAWMLMGLLLAGCEKETAELKVQPGREIGGLKIGTVPKVARSEAEQRTSTEVPIALQGRWAVISADCTSDTGNPDGLLVIGSNFMNLHAAEGRMRVARFRAATALEADFAFIGKDRTWTSTENLSLEGDTLYRKNASVPIALPYERCA